MAQRFRLIWDLADHGWAVCQLDDGASQTRLIASYLTDALGDLVSGMTALYTPRPVERFFFDSEPQELRWVLRRMPSGIEVTIYSFPDSSTSFALPDAAGTVRWRTTRPRNVVVHAALEAAQDVLRQHGEDGYRAKWVEHPFPVAALHDLRRLHLSEDECDLEHDLSHP